MPKYTIQEDLERLRDILVTYLKLPLASDAIPGAFLEAALAHVRESEVRPIYDYVDVVDRKGKVGWSVKSTRAATPLTWKRAKLPNKEKLINNSFESEVAAQELGAKIIDLCNRHARESMEKYGLEEILYARLVLWPDGNVVYFERSLCTIDDPRIFHPENFSWKWSSQKETKGKEQLRALHGFCKKTKAKWWAWHGLGENQLHFSGERNWWPLSDVQNEGAIRFMVPQPDEKLDFERLVDALSRVS